MEFTKYASTTPNVPVTSAVKSLCVFRDGVWKHDGTYDHQTFQVPKMEVLTYISCMYYKAYVRENPSPKWPYKVQYLHFRYLTPGDVEKQGSKWDSNH